MSVINKINRKLRSIRKSHQEKLKFQENVKFVKLVIQPLQPKK